MTVYDEKRKGRICFILRIFLFLLIFTGYGSQNEVCAYGASGQVYTCTINRTYSHPVTGLIEDSGGASSTATGQGMVEGCVGTSGILEVTDSGEYYLTFRLGLADYTSKHEFSVQTMGDPSFTGVDYEETGSGSDDSGTTIDYRVKVPSESCIVRCSMYVDLMGRNVIFYIYPSDYSQGNSTDMTAGIVTEKSSDAGDASADEASSDDISADGDLNPVQASGADNGEASGFADNGGTSGSAEYDGTSDSADLNSSRGLSLSTAEDGSAVSGESEAASERMSMSPLTFILCLVCALTISGLILILVTAWIVYYFRKNWKRWGGGRPMEADEEAGSEAGGDIFFGPGFGGTDEDDFCTDGKVSYKDGNGSCKAGKAPYKDANESRTAGKAPYTSEDVEFLEEDAEFIKGDAGFSEGDGEDE